MEHFFYFDTEEETRVAGGKLNTLGIAHAPIKDDTGLVATTEEELNQEDQTFLVNSLDPQDHLFNRSGNRIE